MMQLTGMYSSADFCHSPPTSMSKLHSYTGEHIKVLGIAQFKVRYGNKELYLSML